VKRRFFATASGRMVAATSCNNALHDTGSSFSSIFPDSILWTSTVRRQMI
jgi:hypothetical protein